MVYDELDLPWTASADQDERFGGWTQRCQVNDRRVENGGFTRVRVGIHPDHEIEMRRNTFSLPGSGNMRNEVEEMVVLYRGRR